MAFCHFSCAKYYKLKFNYKLTLKTLVRNKLQLLSSQNSNNPFRARFIFK